MSCDCPEPLDCCQRCPEPPAPVMPRCDVILADGTFTNSTVVVEDGCITAVTSGRPPQYSPAVCCDDNCGGNGEGGSGEPGPPGRPGRDGENASLEIGQVHTVPSDESASVVNVGSDTNAVLDIYIPRGEPGPPGQDTSGISDSTAGIVFQDGVLQTLPGAWPPALAFTTESDTQGAELSFSQPDQHTGVAHVSLSLSTMVDELKEWVEDRMEEEHDPMLSRLEQLESKVADLEALTQALQTQITNCCDGP